MKTKLLSIVTLAAVLALCLSVSAFASTKASGTYNNITWELSDSGVLTVSGTGKADFPGTDGVPWRSMKDEITSAIINDGITELCGSEFQDCTNLKTVSLPSTLTSIGDSTFSQCTSLESVVIPRGVKSIYTYAFSNCTSLKSVSIPDTVTFCEGTAFGSCKAMESVYITDIEAWCSILFGTKYHSSPSANPMNCGANLYCNGVLVEDLVIPDSVTAIAENAFVGCESITSLTMPEGITKIGEYAFSGCKNLRHVTIPRDCEMIDKYAFKDCTSLRSCTLTIDTETIGKSAFSGCTKLTDIFFYYGTSQEWNDLTIGDDNAPVRSAAIHYWTEMLTWKLSSEGVLTVSGIDGGARFKENGAPWRDYLTKIKSAVIEESLVRRSICEDAFKNCTAMESVTIPKVVTEIGENAFYGCTALKTVIYQGEDSDWNNITIQSGNDALQKARLNRAYIAGDIDKDDTVSDSDAKRILNYILKKEISFSDVEQAIADVTGNSNIDVGDLQAIYRHVKKAQAILRLIGADAA